jgi:hypothetical protein
MAGMLNGYVAESAIRSARTLTSTRKFAEFQTGISFPPDGQLRQFAQPQGAKVFLLLFLQKKKMLP